MSRRKKRKRRKPDPSMPSVPVKKELVLKEKSRGCSKCGEKRPHMLDLHHKNPKTKRFGISRGVRTVMSMHQFKAELRKCIPLCRNHHADYHHREVYDKITLEEYLNDD